MTFADFVSLPEVRYIGVPVAASATGILFSVLSRPYGHMQTKKDD
jgi:hypothetical protein